MSERPFTLHPARAEDLGDILVFIRALARYEKLSHEVVASEEKLGEWLFGDRPAAEVTIARAGGKAVGFALFFTTFSTFLGRPGIHLEDLFVDPEHRGIGIGKALLQHLARISCDRGYGRLEWAVLDWNEPAIRFYESIGAAAMDDWTIWRITGQQLQLMAQESG